MDNIWNIAEQTRDSLEFNMFAEWIKSTKESVWKSW